MNSQPRQKSFGTVSCDEQGIVTCVFNKNTVMTEQVAYDSNFEILALAPGRPCYVLIDITSVKSSTKEAERFGQSRQRAEEFIAMALVHRTKLLHYLVRGFIRNQPVPTKVFNTIDSAKQWLLELRDS